MITNKNIHYALIIIFTEGLILRDCVEYRQLGVHTSGVYPVSPNGENIFQVHEIPFTN